MLCEKRTDILRKKHDDSYEKRQIYHSKPACDNLHHPKHWFKDGVKHHLRVSERVKIKRFEDQFDVAQRLPQSSGHAIVPATPAHASQQQVRDCRAGTHVQPLERQHVIFSLLVPAS